MKQIPISGPLSTAVLGLGDVLYCAVIGDFVEVFDGYALKRVAQIKTKELVTRMLMVKKKYIICSEYKGFI
jgi:hypothetical protein